MIWRLLHALGHSWRYKGCIVHSAFWECAVCGARTVSKTGPRFSAWLPLSPEWHGWLKHETDVVPPARTFAPPYDQVFPKP